MIPKIIHYCWFGGADMPQMVKWCIKSWHKHLPDYTFKLWNESNFDINSVPFVREAYKTKKWAFVADYVRLYALYTEGGIYLDTDVKVYKSFNLFLSNDFFSSLEVQPVFFDKEKELIDKKYNPIFPETRLQSINILSAIMGSVAYHPYLKDCLNLYKKLSFDPNNTRAFIIGPYISKIAERYGFKYKDSEQVLKCNMHIYDKYTFVGNKIFNNKGRYAVHLCDGSWNELKQTKFDNFRRKYPDIASMISVLKKITYKLKLFRLTKTKYNDKYPNKK